MPDTKHDTKHVIKVLREELALQTQHRKLLEAQEQALLACDRARFVALQVEHARMLGQLEAQDAACREALRDNAGSPVTLSALKATAPAGSLRALTALEDGLQGTLTQVQALTRRNKTLIQNELDYLAFTLDLFLEAGRCADAGYGGNGRMAGRLLLDRRA